MKVSPSRLKALEQCTYSFYLRECLKLPEKPFARTLSGSLVHKIFELLLAKKRAKRLKSIMTNGLQLDEGLRRFIRRWCARQAIPYDYQEIEDMLNVGFLAIKPYYHDKWVYYTEKRYEIVFPDFIISGVIDLLIELEDSYVIIDFKSQRNPFKENELLNNLQASSYQLNLWKTFKKVSKVEFVMLRHPPTKRKPEKHIQRVEPRTEAQHEGFMIHLQHMYKVMNKFGLGEAYSGFCKDKGFCDYVCQFKKPFQYQSVTHPDKPGEVVNYLMDKKVELKPGEKLEIRAYSGCPRFNS